LSISIIGTGNVGSALAHVFARNKVEALIANTRGPATFRELTAHVGPAVRGVELSEALASDVILLAIPFLAVESLGGFRRDWSGKTIVDVTNAFLLPNADEVLAGRLSTEIVADAFPGAETVKAFNQLPANVLARDHSGERGKPVVFVSSNSAGASARVAELAERLGFSAIELGRLDEGGRLIQARNALVLRNLIELPMS
jgi:predicted dinucleotide-binding enzyme